ncbi:hypothetical protein TSAR_016487, partial [Trichomalopsis sarcophagae]
QATDFAIWNSFEYQRRLALSSKQCISCVRLQKSASPITKSTSSHSPRRSKSPQTQKSRSHTYTYLATSSSISATYIRSARRRRARFTEAESSIRRVAAPLRALPRSIQLPAAPVNAYVSVRASVMCRGSRCISSCRASPLHQRERDRERKTRERCAGRTHRG